MHQSPWLSQVPARGPYSSLQTDLETEVLIVGAGISGVATAYFVLKNTNKSLILVEGGRVAGGASGHNAGIVFPGFEKPLVDIVAEFGTDLAIQAFKDLDTGFELISKIIKDESLDIDFKTVEEFRGFAYKDHIYQQLQELELQRQLKLDFSPLLIRSDIGNSLNLDNNLDGLYRFVSPEELHNCLNTSSNMFLAARKYRSALANSALLCELIVKKLIEDYPDRFQIYENTYIQQIAIQQNKSNHPNRNICAKSFSNWIYSEKLILCTNGFENIDFIADSDKFNWQHEVRSRVYGVVGFMYGKLSSPIKQSKVVNYSLNPDSEKEYYYISNRQFPNNDSQKELISVGGPEKYFLEGEIYHSQANYGEFSDVEKTLSKFYDLGLVKKEKATTYKWHGLMGYTPNKMRLIGPDPRFPEVLFNLGCNGIGLVPAVFGGYKISCLINGKDLGKSVFDVK